MGIVTVGCSDEGAALTVSLAVISKKEAIKRAITNSVVILVLCSKNFNCFFISLLVLCFTMEAISTNKRFQKEEKTPCATMAR